MSNDYQEFLKEIEEQKQERIESECNQGLHSWHSGYNFTECSTCGISVDSPTASEYLADS